MGKIRRIVRLYQGFFLPIFLGITAVGVLIFGVFPVVKNTIDLASQASSIRPEVIALKEKASLIRSLDEDSLKANIQAMLAAVPSEKSLATLFGTVETQTAKAGVSIIDLGLANAGGISSQSAAKQTAQEKTVGSSLIPFSLTIQGTPEQIRVFLSGFVGIRRFFRIRNFDVTFLDTGNAALRLSMDAFYAPLSTKLSTKILDPVKPLTQIEESLLTSVALYPIVSQDVLDVRAVQPVSASKSDPFSP